MSETRERLDKLVDKLLAQALAKAGALDARQARALIQEVHARREAGGEASLAGLLIERRAVPAATLQPLFEEITLTLADPGSSGRAAARKPAPTTFGDYRVLREIARGGMGAVYEARDERSGIVRAVKTLRASGLESDAAGEELARFRREARLLARLDHPHVVAVHTAELDTDSPYLVQDLLTGGSLQERLRGGPLPIPEVALYAAQLARGLEHAHRRGVLHRDLKPKNVVFDDRGDPRLVDFGLARALGDSSFASLTLSGDVLGTPNYMAPEQAVGSKQIDERTDVYGMGAILYAMLVGGPPFAGQALMEILEQVVHDDPPTPRDLRPEVPRDLERVCLRALEKEPEDRYPSAGALAAAIEGCSTEPGWRWPVGPRTLRRAAAAAVGLLGCAALGLIAVSVAARDTGGEVPASPANDVPRRPTLRVLDPKPGQVIWGDTLRLSGVVEGPKGNLTVEVAGEQRRVRTGRVFELTLRLRPEQTELRLTATSRRQEDAEPLLLPLQRGEPLWFRQLDDDARPEVPLPEGLLFGAPGEYVNERDGSVLVYVPPGRFRMGDARDGPEVELSRGYWIGKFELDWGRYRRFCAETGRETPDNLMRLPEGEGEFTRFRAPDDHPVFFVTWDEAAAYCEWAGLRLPTEAEWAYAARGPKSFLFPWGNGPPSAKRLNLCAANTNMGWRVRNWTDPFEFTAPVDSYPDGVSPFGAHNMSGNIHEFVADFYSTDLPRDGSVDPTGPGGGDLHVIRGGCWRSNVGHCRLDGRNTFLPNDTLGFRVAR